MVYVYVYDGCMMGDQGRPSASVGECCCSAFTCGFESVAAAITVTITVWCLPLQRLGVLSV